MHSAALASELEAKLALDDLFRPFISLVTIQSRAPRYNAMLVSCTALSSYLPGISLLPGFALGSMKESFGQRLRRLRDDQGLSVVDLASAVGVSQGAIRQLEAGNVKTPSFLLGLRLAIALNVDAHYLALGEGSSLTERLDVLERRITKIEQRLGSLPATRR